MPLRHEQAPLRLLLRSLSCKQSAGPLCGTLKKRGLSSPLLAQSRYPSGQETQNLPRVTTAQRGSQARLLPPWALSEREPRPRPPFVLRKPYATRLHARLLPLKWRATPQEALRKRHTQTLYAPLRRRRQTRTTPAAASSALREIDRLRA